MLTCKLRMVRVVVCHVEEEGLLAFLHHKVCRSPRQLPRELREIGRLLGHLGAVVQGAADGVVAAGDDAAAAGAVVGEASGKQPRFNDFDRDSYGVVTG